MRSLCARSGDYAFRVRRRVGPNTAAANNRANRGLQPIRCSPCDPGACALPHPDGRLRRRFYGDGAACCGGSNPLSRRNRLQGN